MLGRFLLRGEAKSLSWRARRSLSAAPSEYHPETMLALLRRRGPATFALLVVVTKVTGRSLTTRIDRALHVAPMANSHAAYYPFLLVAVKVVAALALAALLARAMRARASADAGGRLLQTFGHRERAPVPRLRATLSPRIWFGSLAATSAVYLVQADVEGAAAGRWPLFSPLLHTSALPVFAALAVLVAFAWRFARWIYDTEDFAHSTLERVRRMLVVAARPATRYARTGDDTAPRKRFGIAFESRPPPLAC